MQVYNKITDTNPIVLHAQGNARGGKRWPEVVEHSFDYNIQIPENTTIVTFQHGIMKAPLTMQLAFNEINYINAANGVEDFHLFDWKHKYKILLFNEVLSKIDTEYIISLDCIDVILMQDFSEIIERFKEFNCGALYGASMNNHPNGELSDAHLSALSPYPFKYLNAGTMVGKTSFLRSFYQDLMDWYDTFDYSDSEQLQIRKHAINFDIKVDYECKIFQTLDRFGYKIDHYNNRVLIDSCK